MESPYNKHCNPELMQRLSELQLQVNPLAKSFRMLFEISQIEEEQALQNHRPIREMELQFDSNRSPQKGIFNKPTSNDIAAVLFPSEDGNTKPGLLTIQPKGNKLKTISHLDKRADSFLYPLLFLNGETGWEYRTMQEKKEAKSQGIPVLSLLKYYNWLTHYRPQYWSPIFYAGRLFKQFLVDAAVKIESNNLQFYRENQKLLRVDYYISVKEFLQTKSKEKNLDCGKIFILPSTYKTSKRQLQQSYLDAMTIVSHFGKPTYFITFTCNANWREIQESLLPSQQAWERDDLIIRVFMLKLQELIDDLYDRHILGRVLAFVYVIEFQKRGLPHAHILLTVADSDVPKDPETINKVISAEYPPSTDPHLRVLVDTYMTHHRCGLQHNPHAPCCNEAGECTRGFPKPFQDHTSFVENKFPLYQRSHNDERNQWIVPYNPYILRKYEAHCNVELCASILGVKYLYKYIFKGYDTANLVISSSDSKTLNYNEIEQHVQARYLSSCEAYFIIKSFSREKRSVSVQRLDLHDKDKQSVVFDPDELDNAEEPTSKTSSLMAFFSLCSKHKTDFDNGKLFLDSPASQKRQIPNPNTLTYINLPQHYRWMKSTQTWIPRTNQTIQLGRLPWISPTQNELYYLRCLLVHVPGPNSFSDLLSFNKVQYSSYRDATFARGLIQDDKESEESLLAASDFHMPFQLRRLFAAIIIYNNPSDPLRLWNKYKSFLCDDFTGRLHLSLQQAEQKAFWEISDTCSQSNKDLQKILGISYPTLDSSPLPTSQSFETEEDLLRLISTFNPQQQDAYNQIVTSIFTDTPTQTCFFLDGPGGSGKTYLYDCLNLFLRLHNIPTANVAWSGIAATLLHNGSTFRLYGQYLLQQYESQQRRMHFTQKDTCARLGRSSYG
jgi:hypothetical protein